MKPLVISRKDQSGYGGLSRFFAEFVNHYPKPLLSISPANFYDALSIPLRRFDVIYLCDATLLPFGVILKKFFKKPLFVSAHGLDLNFSNSLYQFMLARLLPRSDGIILDSNPARKLINNFNLPKEKVFVINPGVSVNHLIPLDLPDYPDLPNLKDKIILLTVGNLISRKGHQWFIENVFKNLSRDFIYLIVGQGPEKKKILQTVKKLKLTNRVFLLGKLTHPQLKFVSKKADIYVSPNQQENHNFESFGIAAGEAASLGIPVIACKVDGIPEAIKNNKNGLLVNPDPKSFINAINELKNPKKRQIIGQKAAHYTKKHYQWQKTSQKYFTVFQQVAGRS